MKAIMRILLPFVEQIQRTVRNVTNNNGVTNSKKV